MSRFRTHFTRSTLPLLVVVCLAALSFTYAFADDSARPLAVTVIGDPDAAVNGRFAVGSASVGSKALTVTGVIDFLGAGTVHNYFTQGAGNNMQITTNVDEANTIGDASRSQWKLVMGSNLDWFSIRRSPAGGTYNEDALFFVEGSTGNVGIATVDTANGATIAFTPLARLHVETPSGDAVYGNTTDSNGSGVYGFASATTGYGTGVRGLTYSTSGSGVAGESFSTAGAGVFGQSWGNYGVVGRSYSTNGRGVYGEAAATTGDNTGVFGLSNSTDGVGVFGRASATTGFNYGVFGWSDAPSGSGVYYLGGLAGTGTKSAVVETQDYGWRLLYAVESPQNWFEDFGRATLAAGEAVVPIEPIFAQTVNLALPYHVFLTALDGFCSLYVTEQTASSFTVRAQEGPDCEIAFHYRIIAPRLDYEDLRLKPAQDPQEVAASMPPAPPDLPSP